MLLWWFRTTIIPNLLLFFACSGAKKRFEDAGMGADQGCNAQRL